MNPYFALLVAVGLLTGCATALLPPLKADDPANPSVAETTARPHSDTLGVDDLTKKTRRIFAKAATEQEASPTPTPNQRQMEGMPGMSMPSE
jgi:hypothetical protein